MGTWPQIGPVVPAVLAPWFSAPFDRVASSVSPNVSTVWGTANQAYFYPVWVPDPCVVTKLWWQNGATASGNVDVGIYTDQGNRLISTGATTQTGTSLIQSLDITDTPIPAGLCYFAIALSSATGTIWMVAASLSGSLVLVSGYQQAAACPLPNPATFATTVGTNIGLMKFGALVAPRTVL
jgi:hypothetical protein